MLSSFFEIRAALIVELLLSVRCSALCLSVLQRLLVRVLELVGSWSLLHAHHGSATSLWLVLAVVHLTHASVESRVDSTIDSTFPWHNRVLRKCWSLWLLPDDVKHAVLKCLLVFTEPVLFPSVIKNLGVQVIPLHALLKETDAELVIGVLFKFESPAVLHILLKFDGIALTQLIKRGLKLLLLNILILLILILPRQILPRQAATEEVEDDMADGFEVVSSTLFLTHMCCQTSISCRACKILALDEGNVLALGVTIALGQSKVDYVDIVLGQIGSTYEEVIWLNITVDDPLVVHLLDSLDHLLSNKAARLKVEFTLALHEEVLK